jgi:outer membrane protein assembly factor BamE (lipoprotein component of BamABCDE complex)
MREKMKAIALILPTLLFYLVAGCRQEQQSPDPATALASESRILSLYDQLKIGMTKSQVQAIVGKPLFKPLRQSTGEEGCWYVDKAERKMEYNESPWGLGGISVTYKADKLIEKEYNSQWVKPEHIEAYKQKKHAERFPTLNNLMVRADVIVSTRILQTDYRLIAKDGPMIGKAKIANCIKGKLSRGDIVGFSETTWWCPIFKAGETGILFLKRQEKSLAERAGDYTPWRTVRTDRLDFLIDPDGLPESSQARVKKFLEETQETRELQRSEWTRSYVRL